MKFHANKSWIEVANQRNILHRDHASFPSPLPPSRAPNPNLDPRPHSTQRPNRAHKEPRHLRPKHLPNPPSPQRQRLPNPPLLPPNQQKNISRDRPPNLGTQHPPRLLSPRPTTQRPPPPSPASNRPQPSLHRPPNRPNIRQTPLLPPPLPTHAKNPGPINPHRSSHLHNFNPIQRPKQNPHNKSLRESNAV